MSTLDKIINLLAEQHKKQIDLCNYIGVKKNAFTNWKAGVNHSYKKHIDKIAEFFGVSTDYLLGRTDIPNKKNETAPSDEETVKLTPHEVKLVLAYRSKPEMQESVNILLGIKSQPDLSEDMAETVNKTALHPIRKN